jgi:hypothetical protein
MEDVPLYKYVESLTLQPDINTGLLDHMFRQYRNLTALNIKSIFDMHMQAQVIEMISKHRVPIKKIRLNVLECQVEEESTEEEMVIELFSQLEVLALHLHALDISNTFLPSVERNLRNLHTLEIICTTPIEIKDCLTMLQPDAASKFKNSASN